MLGSREDGKMEIRNDLSQTPQPSIEALPDRINIPLPTKAPEPVQKPIGGLPSVGSIKIQPLNTANAASLIPSLTDLERIATGDEEKGPQLISGEEKQPFTPEQFLELWKVYTQKANDEHKIHLYTLMNNDPIIEGTNITVLVENSALESTLQNEKVDILNFLRSSLRNFDIQLSSKRAENNTKKRIYTNKDKYSHLVDKNPQLEELRKRFNLDINP
jgi:DNA polymerase-3 subunit gamma/tau